MCQESKWKPVSIRTVQLTSSGLGSLKLELRDMNHAFQPASAGALPSPTIWAAFWIWLPRRALAASARAADVVIEC